MFSKKNLTVPKKTERGTLWNFPTSILSQNSKKLKGGPFGDKKKFRKKSRTVPKKTQRGTLWNFPTSILSQNSKKLKGGPFGDKKKFRKKSRTVPKKTQRGDPIVSSGFVSYDKNGVTERGDPLHYLKYAPRLPIQYFSLVVLFCKKCPLRIHSVI